jgi:hypothetical protein
MDRTLNSTGTENCSLDSRQLNYTLWRSVGLRLDVVDLSQLLLDVTVVVFLRRG